MSSKNIRKMGAWISLLAILATAVSFTIGAGTSDAVYISPQKAATTSIALDATDTVAGYSALLRIANAPSNAKLEIEVQKPDTSKVILGAQSDRYGAAKLDIDGYFTKNAGEYQIRARLIQNESTFNSAETFTVYPDTVSTSRSTLELSKKTASANGNDFVELQVNLRDRYNNAIPGHTLEVISSKLTDEIVRISPALYTNEQGNLIYNVYSTEAGVSTLIVHDSTSGITLNDRAEIAFYSPLSANKNWGGHSSYNAYGNNGYSSILFADTLGADSNASSIQAQTQTQTQNSPANTLSIENIPSETSIGETLNVTVSAYDENGKTDINYNGAVHFSSSDSNAKLPNDYTFDAEDQGMHTFSLGLAFKTVGTQTLTVTDLDNAELTGEIDVDVEAEGAGKNKNGPLISGDLIVNTPMAGTYSSNRLQFSGEAPYGMIVEIQDNDILIGETNVTPKKEFNYEVTNLEEGQHNFILRTKDSNDAIHDTTDVLEVTIDTTAPELNQITIEPEGDILTGDPLTISVQSEPDLAQVSVSFNDGVFNLEEDQGISGIYKGTFIAPEEAGEYQMNAILIDELGNELSQTGVAIFKVIPDEVYPGKVTGVTVTPEDGKATLTWEIPTTAMIKLDSGVAENASIDPPLILHYRIYYGPDAELLYSSVDTIDNSTSWYIPNLQNGTTYYFAVTAVSEDDKESLERSNAVSAMPESAEGAMLYKASLEDAALLAEEAAKAAALAEALKKKNTPDTGPEVIWLLSLSGGLASAYTQLRLRRKKSVQIVDIR